MTNFVLWLCGSVYCGDLGVEVWGAAAGSGAGQSADGRIVFHCTGLGSKLPIRPPKRTHTITKSIVLHFHGRIAAQRGFIPAKILVHNDTAGDNGTFGVTLNQSVLGFLVG